MTTDLVTDTYVGTTRLDVHELVRQLNEHLGPTLVAALAGVRDSKLPHKWAKADGPVPRQEARDRLTVAHRVWLMISSAENSYVAWNWFTGLNPWLGEVAPVIAIREGRLNEVLAAAEAFTRDSYDL